MPDDLPFVPDATLDLVDPRWWLDLCCACGRSTSISHKLLAKRHGARGRGCSISWRGYGARGAARRRPRPNGSTTRPGAPPARATRPGNGCRWPCPGASPLPCPG